MALRNRKLHARNDDDDDALWLGGTVIRGLVVSNVSLSLGLCLNNRMTTYGKPENVRDFDSCQ